MSCGVPYVGESIVPINKRMNIHRTAKTGCTNFIHHYTKVCPGAKFSIQILEKLPGDGYLNGAIDEKMRERRLEREDYWMKTLRTVYPYGLNEKTKFMNQDTPIGILFPPLPRHGQKFLEQRNRTNISGENPLSKIIPFLSHINSVDVKHRGNHTRKLLDGFKRKHLKSLASEANDRLEIGNTESERWCKLILDTFFTKIYKKPLINDKKSPSHIFPIFFDNKGLDHIKLASILNDNDVQNLLPPILKNQEPPSVVYRLGNTIRNKIFNYKETVSAIDINDTETFGTGLATCDCHDSEFVNEHHQHVVTGDLRIIQNGKLRKLISKGPNFREPKTINWGKCREKIVEGLTECTDRMISSVKNVQVDDMIPWQNVVLEKVDAKITSLKRKIMPQKTNPILKQPDIVQYLQNFHKKYVLVPIDKAANNVAIICKRHYVEVILKEIRVSPENNTYVSSQLSSNEIIFNNIEYAKNLGLKVDDKDLSLPDMYWMPKMHKHPSGCRFIIASKHCSTKSLSKAISSVFKLIFTQVEKFHKNAKFLNNYNKFWVLQNSDPIIDILKHINRKRRAKSIATYDFSTLYTKLPHTKLIQQLSKVIDLVFKGGDKRYIQVSNYGTAFWSKYRKGVYFTKTSLKAAISHLITNCYFVVGNIIMRQAIGIPMGIDPAPFWANLFLYTYEEQYVKTTIASNPIKARHFHSTKRFIDDLCAINDGGEFGRVFNNIYPEELELKVEHCGCHASFLNLDITIEDNIFVYKLYDKRDNFPFHIVRMPHRCSNIPQNIFYSSLVGEFLRIARSTLKSRDFFPRVKDLLKRMRNQGATLEMSRRFLKKLINSHPNSFKQFSLSTNQIIIELFL